LGTRGMVELGSEGEALRRKGRARLALPGKIFRIFWTTAGTLPSMADGLEAVFVSECARLRAKTTQERTFR